MLRSDTIQKGMMLQSPISLSMNGMMVPLGISLSLFFICLILIIFLFMQLRRLAREAEKTNHLVLRLERDLSKHRYAIAKYLGEAQRVEDSLANDRQLLQSTMQQAENALKLEQGDMPPASLSGLSDGQILDFLKKALATNGVAVYQQPLVALPSRKPRYYEVFSRILIGNEGYIPANKFIAVAKNHNLVNAIDNLLLMQCLQILKNTAHKEKQTEFFINVTSETFGSREYMDKLLAFLSANPRLSSRLIFELTQKDSLNLGNVARNVMDSLALLGCRFSMDQVTILGMDLDRLLDLNISFVKLDMNAMQKDLANTAERKRIKRIKHSLDTQGITAIIEKVENEKQLFNVLDMHFDIAQGYLFGKPAPMGE